jgi:hypothetical protein
MKNFTIDYGLRWDYQGFPYEKFDRRSMFDPNLANPSAGGLKGATAYEGDGTGACGCRFVKTYPYSFGPRVGGSYQITPKTVLRAGWGISYSQTNGGQSNGGGTLGAGGWKTVNFDSPAFGEAANLLRNGLQYNRDALFTVVNDAGIRPSPGLIDLPSAWIGPDAGKMPKMTQWSISLQREVTKDLMVEAAYVGNRGSGFDANNLVNLNAISEDRLRSFGLDLHNTNDQALLRARMDSALAISRGFNKAPYVGYSLANTVAQSLRPYPQFGNLTATGIMLGQSWYDSLQVKAVKRYGYGLNLTATFTWQKEMNNLSTVNDVFAPLSSQKQLSSRSEPLATVLAFNYQVPAWGSNRFVQVALGGWTVGGIVRYASGAPIPTPTSQNQLNALVFQSTRMNRVDGQPLYTKDLNGGEIDPNADFVLNPLAWSDPAQGTFGTSDAYYDDFRYQRRPDEQFSIGRVFGMGGGRKLSVRGEFFNAFNRTQMLDPAVTPVANPLQTQLRNAQGIPISGWGRIDTGKTYGPPRSGQLVARISW